MALTWANGLLLATLAICTVTDLRSRKIYNAVLFPVLGAALAGHGWFGGWGGIGGSILGLLTGLGILLIPYFMGGMGAGDVKLLAVVGALQGAAFAASAAIYMAMIGLVLSVGVLLAQQKTRKFLKYVFFTLYGWKSGVRMPFPRRGEALSATVPYGVAIAGGAVATLLWEGLFPV